MPNFQDSGEGNRYCCNVIGADENTKTYRYNNLGPTLHGTPPEHYHTINILITTFIINIFSSLSRKTTRNWISIGARDRGKNDIATEVSRPGTKEWRSYTYGDTNLPLLLEVAAFVSGIMRVDTAEEFIPSRRSSNNRCTPESDQRAR